MDCCNYMPYRHPQAYYGYHSEPVPQFQGEYYGQQSAYHEYYRSMGPYYDPQHWQGGGFVSQDYVYNPKEARIRKAMREAASRDNRDRSIGGSPMLARPNARRAPPSHGWTQATHDDLMMSPLPSGMRSSGLDSPCYATTAATSAGPGVVGPFLASGMGYSSTEMRRESNGPPQNAGYMQPNPLTQLHQQTEMWNNFQDEMRPRSSGNPFMMHQDLPSHPYHQPSPPLSIPSPRAMDQPPHPLHTLAPAPMPMTPPHPHANAPITPPHSNENVPPDEWAAGEVKVAPSEGSLYANATPGEGGQPYGSERRGEGEEQHERMQQQQLDKEDHMRQCKKRAAPPPPQPPLPLPPHQAASAPTTRPLPDFNEAFGSTERGHFQSPPDPRLGGHRLDLFYGDGCPQQPQPPALKFGGFQL